MAIFMNKHLFGLPLVFASIISLAQPTPEALEAIKKQYPNARQINLERQQTFIIKNSGGKLNIKGDYHFQTLVLDDKLVTQNERKINYSPGFYEITDIEASTLVPDGNKYKKLPVKTFVDEGNMNGEAFYDGVKIKKFFYPGVTYGAITQLDFSYQFYEPSFLGAFYFSPGSPAVKQSLKVEVGSDVTIGYKFFGDSSKVKLTKTVSGSKTTYIWECNDVDEDKYYDDAVNFRYYEPHIYVYVANYKSASETKTLFSTPTDLYRHDYQFVKILNKDKPVDQLAQLIDSINTHSTSTEDRIRKTYYWVQQHIKYIAFEDGLGGQIPRQANDVFVKKYGDCKDLASLITFMLNQMNIPAYLTWIGTRDLPYSYYDLPLGYASNHMIAAVKSNDKWVFIDGTSKHTAYGTPSQFTQGKEGLISISPDSFVIQKVEIMAPAVNLDHEIISLTLKQEQLVGQGKRSISGYHKSNILSSVYYSGIDKKTEILEGVLKLGNNKCKIDHVTHNDFTSNDSTLELSYQFTLPDYVRFIDNEIYVNMHLRKLHGDDKIDTAGKRMAPRANGYGYLYDLTNEFILPDGYQVKKIPAGINLSENGFEYKVTYVQKDNKIIYRQVTSLNKLIIDASEFDSWNKRIDAINKNYKELVVLKRNN